MRRHNLALVLQEVADREPVSRAGVAARTGLARGTVSSLVEQLIDGGLVTELAAARGGTGRPANPLQLNRSGPAGLGLEIGVDHVGACVVDLAGTVRAARTEPSAHRDRAPGAGLDAAAELAAAVAAEAGLAVCGAAVAVPGLIAEGRLQHAPNLPRWTDVDLGVELAHRLGDIPVDAGNEADLAALAELWFGGVAADPAVDFLFVSGGYRCRRRHRARRRSCSAGAADGPASWGTSWSNPTVGRAAAVGGAAWSSTPVRRLCCGRPGRATSPPCSGGRPRRSHRRPEPWASR